MRVIGLTKPSGAVKAKSCLQLEGRRASRSPAISNQPRIVGNTQSIDVGTRKMVNYAWPGWSQGKPWWRTVAILTCKSIVKLGYRGERLIEPSSCWFPPKFPSGFLLDKMWSISVLDWFWIRVDLKIVCRKPLFKMESIYLDVCAFEFRFKKIIPEKCLTLNR